MKYLILIINCMVLLAGCANGRDPYIKDNFGAAVKHNVAMQTINPDADGQDMSDSMDGQKANQAIDNYRKDSGKAADESLIDGVGD